MILGLLDIPSVTWRIVKLRRDAYETQHVS